MIEDKIDAINADIENAMKSISKKYAVDISFGNIRYDDNSFNTKMDVRLKNALSTEAEAYMLNQKSFDLPDLGYTFKDLNSDIKFTVIGFNTRARKNKIKLSTETHDIYTCTIDMLKRAIHHPVNKCGA